MDDVVSVLQLLGGFVLLGLGLSLLWRGLHWFRDRELAERERRRSGLPPVPGMIDRFIDRLMNRHVLKGRSLDPPPPGSEAIRRVIAILAWVLLALAWSLFPIGMFASDRLFWIIVAIAFVLLAIQVVLFGLYVRRVPPQPEGCSTRLMGRTPE